MPFPEIDPYLPFLHWGDFGVRWYALAYVAGILLGWRYAALLARDSRLWAPRIAPATPAQIDDLILWITLGIIAGGRLGYILFYSPAILWTHPVQILQVWHGGMSFHGGLIGVTVALWVYARKHAIAPLPLGDLIAPAVPIGLFFGRLANFINGELWGRISDVPWAVVFCSEHIKASSGGYCPAGILPRHPSQLYEAALEGIVLFLVLRLATHRLRWLRYPGAITGLFLAAYAVFRISLENVRNPDLSMPEFPLGLTMGMMLSTPMLLIGGWLLRQGLKTARTADGTDVAH